MIFRSSDGDLINSASSSPYFKKVKDFIIEWERGVNDLEVKTSGSTGVPKNIKLSVAQIKASVAQTAKNFYLDQSTLFVCNLSMDFIAGKLMIIRAIELGADLLVISPEGDFLENLGNQKYFVSKNMGRNFFAFVPMQLEKLVKNEEALSILNTARAIIIGGAAINKTLAKSIKAIKAPVYATYGMTETVTHMAVKRLNGDAVDQNFKTLGDTKIKTDSRGCLCIKNKATEDKWIITNDLVDLIGPEEFKLQGRIDRVINSGGIKLNLDTLEQKIDKVINLKSAFFCHGLPDERLGQKLVLFIEGSAKENGIMELLKLKMLKFDAPKEVVYFSPFQRTGSGKIDKIKTVNAYSISNK